MIKLQKISREEAMLLGLDRGLDPEYGYMRVATDKEYAILDKRIYIGLGIGPFKMTFVGSCQVEYRVQYALTNHDYAG